jgi:regulatory protein
VRKKLRSKKKSLLDAAKKSGPIDSRMNGRLRSQAVSVIPGDAVRLAIRFLAKRDRTIAQVEQFLRSKGASSPQIAQAIHRLSDLRYLNDHAYAQRWVNKRLAVRPMGEARLKVELQAKGISESLAAQVTAEAFREIDEKVLAQRAIQAAQRHGRRSTLSQMVRLLRQRGFSEDTIDRMIMDKSRINEEPLHEE